MKTAYFDCFAGASGDMILGSLVDAGLNPGLLILELQKLGLHDCDLSFKQVVKKGLGATQAIVSFDSRHHGNRCFSDICSLIKKSSLSEDIKEKSISIFTRLAEAEARVHRTSVEAVHFHEVGAVDAIIDVVGAVAGLFLLGIDEVYCSPLHVGTGTVICAHGILPLPAPATFELVRGVPIYSTEVHGELLTPTGAAILTTLSKGFGQLPAMTTEALGYGAGAADRQIPNLLRIVIGNTCERDCFDCDQAAVIETAIDDMNPQIYDHIMEKALEMGALDIYLKPVQMKKNRPGIILSILCKPEDVGRFSRFVLSETTSIGLRWRFENRIKVKRDILEITTSLGNLRVKKAHTMEGTINFLPEYEDCKKIARQKNIPLKMVMAKVCKEALPDDVFFASGSGNES